MFITHWHYSWVFLFLFCWCPTPSIFSVFVHPNMSCTYIALYPFCQCYESYFHVFRELRKYKLVFHAEAIGWVLTKSRLAVGLGSNLLKKLRDTDVEGDVAKNVVDSIFYTERDPYWWYIWVGWGCRKSHRTAHHRSTSWCTSRGRGTSIWTLLIV